MRERNELILADLVAVRAQQMPDFDVVTFDGGGIRHNGDFVNPGFVEKVIAEHPQVDDVFVYGVPGASGAPGESDVVAAVVPVDAGTFDPASVFATCVKGLEPNFVPAYLQVVDEIPKTASEKPQDRFLVDRFEPDGPRIYRQ